MVVALSTYLILRWLRHWSFEIPNTHIHEIETLSDELLAMHVDDLQICIRRSRTTQFWKSPARQHCLLGDLIAVLTDSGSIFLIFTSW